jgi:ferredoxin
MAHKKLERVQAVTIPINMKIQAEHQILSLEYAKGLLKSADLITSMDCVCRIENNNCDAPKNNCLSLNERARKILENENYKELNPRKIDIDEAIEVLKESYKAGLVHMAYAVNNEDINEFCSCCSCCCVALSATLKFGIFPGLLTAIMTEETDPSKCNDCGLCVDRCKFGARKIMENELVVNRSLCYGCGLCVGSCPTNAIKLNPVNQ